MKLSCTQENLNQAVNIASRFVGTRVTLPVLSNILLKTEEGRLKISSTDLEMGLSTWVGAKIDEEGAITLPGRLLQEYISSNTDQTIEISTNGADAGFKSPHFQAEIKGIEAEEFPSIPEVKEEIETKIEKNELKSAILQTTFAASPEETRPALTGVLLRLKGEKGKFVATDSYRLCEKEVKLLSPPKGPLGGNKDKEIIIPSRTLMEVGRLLDQTTEPVEIKIGENQIQFNLGETELISRLIEGSFPDYQTIIPKDFVASAILPKNEFLNATRLAGLFAREQGGNIKIKLEKSKVILAAISPQIGTSTNEIEGETKGEEIEVAFNVKYLLDVLGVLSGDKVELSLAGKLAPGKITTEKDQGFLYLMMPLRQEE